jgi:hypothetical protein
MRTWRNLAFVVLVAVVLVAKPELLLASPYFSCPDGCYCDPVDSSVSVECPGEDNIEADVCQTLETSCFEYCLYEYPNWYNWIHAPNSISCNGYTLPGCNPASLEPGPVSVGCLCMYCQVN